MSYDISNNYFNWLCSLVNDSKPNRESYYHLLTFLHSVDFMYIIPMDGNRYADGINLRYRYGRERKIEDPVIASCLDNNPCSVLEMMVALAVRCEEFIMYNPDKGVLSGRWFWMMVENLGLEDMTDSRFDIEPARSVVYRFLARDYSHDGQGGLVYIPNSPYDLRNMEIWYQMQRYLSEYRRNGD